MWSLIVCDGNKVEREQLMELAEQCFRCKQIEVQVTGCADWSELHDMVKKSLPEIVIVAQDGVDGLNTITSARLLSGKIIWFSNLDFGIQAYRLCVPCFCKKPISYKKMEQALSHFIEKISTSEKIK